MTFIPRGLSRAVACAVLAVLPLAGASRAVADDALKVAIGQRGAWSTAVVELGEKGGFFKKKGLALELLDTAGGGETIQAVLSGSVDVGVALGTASVMGAFAKGAPIRIIGGAFTGAETIWYVPASSPIHKLQDISNNTVAYSSAGASTHLYALAMLKEFGLKAQLVATGSIASTLTQTMSGQVDVGWTAPPVGIKEEQEGQLRFIGSGAQITEYKNQTVRVIGTSPNVLAQRRDALVRFMDAYRDTVNWLYASPDGVKLFAQLMNIDEKVALRTRDEFTPKEMMDPDRFDGIEGLTKDAIAFKFIPAPLTPDQVKTLVQVPFH